MLSVSRRTNAAVVFLGNPAPARDLRPLLPQTFDVRGVSWSRQGHRAAIDAALPADASAFGLAYPYSTVAGYSPSSGKTSPEPNMRPLPRLVRGLALPMASSAQSGGQRPEARGNHGCATGRAGSSCAPSPGVVELPVLAALEYDSAQMRNLRRQVCDELNTSGSSRFLAEEFPTMVEAS